LLFAHEQEFLLLKILFCVGLPVTLVWLCYGSLLLMLKGTVSMFVKAQVALSNVAIEYPGWRGQLKIAGCLVAATVASFLYFAGLIDLKSVQGLQDALLATP
jgi:hypothetical protein